MQHIAARSGNETPTLGQVSRVPGAVIAPTTGDPVAIGPYAIVGRLGAGGMGTVYLGRAPDGRLVAVKVLRRELAADPAFVARFADEMQAARRVAPFCTAPVLDAAPTAVPPWLVTEYVEGVPLDEAVRNGGPLTGSTLDGVAVGIATALTAIHAAGLVHRDLKPANVLLSATGPRVIDFGIARAMDATSTHTSTGMVLGSPGWLAPEILAGQSVTPAADVFAWGLLVAYAATGRHPYGVGSDQQAYEALHGRPQLDGIPQPLVQHVGAALARDPRQRPSAQGLLLALLGPATGRAAAPGDPARAATRVLQQTWNPPDPCPHPRRWRLPRRRRWWRRPRVLLPIGLVALLIVLLGARDDPPGGRTRPVLSPRPSRARSRRPRRPGQAFPCATANWSLSCRAWTAAFPRLAGPAGCERPMARTASFRLRCRNIGRESRQLNEWQVALHDSGGERHTGDVAARGSLSSRRRSGTSVDPGASVRGTLVFDLPEGAATRTA